MNKQKQSHKNPNNLTPSNPPTPAPSPASDLPPPNNPPNIPTSQTQISQGMQKKSSSPNTPVELLGTHSSSPHSQDPESLGKHPKSSSPSPLSLSEKESSPPPNLSDPNLCVPSGKSAKKREKKKAKKEKGEKDPNVNPNVLLGVPKSDDGDRSKEDRSGSSHTSVEETEDALVEEVLRNAEEVPSDASGECCQEGLPIVRKLPYLDQSPDVPKSYTYTGDDKSKEESVKSKESPSESDVHLTIISSAREGGVGEPSSSWDVDLVEPLEDTQESKELGVSESEDKIKDDKILGIQKIKLSELGGVYDLGIHDSVQTLGIEKSEVGVGLQEEVSSLSDGLGFGIAPTPATHLHGATSPAYPYYTTTSTTAAAVPPEVSPEPASEEEDGDAGAGGARNRRRRSQELLTKLSSNFLELRSTFKQILISFFSYPTSDILEEEDETTINDLGKVSKLERMKGYVSYYRRKWSSPSLYQELMRILATLTLLILVVLGNMFLYLTFRILESLSFLMCGYVNLVWRFSYIPRLLLYCMVLGFEILFQVVTGIRSKKVKEEDRSEEDESVGDKKEDIKNKALGKILHFLTATRILLLNSQLLNNTWFLSSYSPSSSSSSIREAIA